NEFTRRRAHVNSLHRRSRPKQTARTPRDGNQVSNRIALATHLVTGRQGVTCSAPRHDRRATTEPLSGYIRRAPGVASPSMRMLIQNPKVRVSRRGTARMGVWFAMLCFIVLLSFLGFPRGPTTLSVQPSTQT